MSARKDGKPKAEKGTKTRTVNGVKYRRCETCLKMKPQEAFKDSLYVWQCAGCYNAEHNKALDMLKDSYTSLIEMGENPFK